VDETAREELSCIADGSGGAYRDATTESEVVAALDHFVDEITASAP
jgi:hypothetical protein